MTAKELKEAQEERFRKECFGEIKQSNGKNNAK